MELGELKRLLSKKQFKPFLIFTGVETSIMNIYIKQISEIMGVSTRRADNVQSIYSKLNCKSLFHDKALFAVKDDKDLLQQEKIWKDLPLYLGNNALVLIYSNLDKRGKFFKQNEQYIVEFEKLTAAQLSNYVMKELSLTVPQATEIAEMCDCDYGRVMLEIDKLKHLRQALNDEPVNPFSAETTDMDCFYYAMQNKLIFTAPKDVVFDFIDAVMKNEHKLAMELLVELKELKTAEVMVLSLLYSNFRNILLVQGSDGTAEKTGLTGWQIQLAKQKTGFYGIQELVENLKTVRNVEKGIKTGKIEASISLEYCLAKCLRR